MDIKNFWPNFSLFLINTGTFLNQTGIKSVGQVCHDQYKSLDEEILFQMIDASTKTINGLLWLDIHQLGNFDECYSIVNRRNSEMVYGKYCLGTISNLTQGTNFPELYVGVCVPNGCTAEDIEKIYSGIPRFSEERCYSQDTRPALTFGAYLTIGILILSITIVIVCTISEITQRRTSVVISAFSALSNGRKLIESTPDQFLCLNGIKAISMMWVILIHVYFGSYAAPVVHGVDNEKREENVSSMIIINGTLAVDSFLTVSGLVTVYWLMKMAEKRVKIRIFRYYLHRYLRLTPSLAIVMLIHSTLIVSLGNGPRWYSVYWRFVKNCREYWWSTLLHTQNYFHGTETCVPQSWYLSIDFQLCLLSPLILVPLKRRPKVGITILCSLVVLGCVIPFSLGYLYKLPAFIMIGNPKTDEMLWRYYKQTYARFGPYVIGMICGYYVYRVKQRQTKFILNSATVMLVWLISIVGLLACIFAPHRAYILSYNVWSHSLIMAFVRNAWAVSLSGVIFMCIAEYGGVIDTFLSLPIFQFLTKLSYAMYLIHDSLIGTRYMSMKTELAFTTELLLWSFWADFMVAFFVSIPFTLTFELPIIALEKIFFGNAVSGSSYKKLTV